MTTVLLLVDGRPQVNHFTDLGEMPASTALSDSISKDMKRRGLHFVGSKIVYAFMQGIGMVDDHVAGCWRRSGAHAMCPMEQ